MIPLHRLVDLSIGLSILGWAVAGALQHHGERPLAVLLATSLLHLTVGVLFLVRWRKARQGDFRSCAIAIPAVLIGGWVFNLAPDRWGVPSQVLFVSGSVLAVASFIFLGRCFSILPAVRGVVTRGPFSYVRHPAYLGELAMVVACIAAAPMHWTLMILPAVVLGCFIARIRVEERLLMAEKSYREYCLRVRWRLMPLIW